MLRGNVPEVEVLGHIHLLEDVHQPLLLLLFFNFVIECHRKEFGALAMVQVVASKERDNRPLRHNDHVPSSSKSDKPWTKSGSSDKPSEGLKTYQQFQRILWPFQALQRLCFHRPAF